MTLVSPTDQDLVREARAGDERAFEELYARYRPRIRAYAFGLTHDHDRAEDVTQEVFISALRRLRESERPIAFRPWIYEIARNACIDEFRRQSRAREVSIDREEESGWDAPLSATAPSAEVAVESKQRLDDLRDAFRGLSERHHQVIVLRELEGLTYSQIGDQLGMSKPVVESTLFRARRRLSEEFDDLASGRRCEYVQRTLSAVGQRPVGTLGLRERRALSRHLEHCQPCRRHAHAAGLTGATWRDRLVGKVAALIPAPLVVLRRRAEDRFAAIGHGAHQAAVQPVASVAQYADGSGQLVGSIGRAFAAGAALLVVAAGGSWVSGFAGNSDHTYRHGAPPQRALLVRNVSDVNLREAASASVAHQQLEQRFSAAVAAHRSSAAGEVGGSGATKRSVAVFQLSSAPKAISGSGTAGLASGGEDGGLLSTLASPLSGGRHGTATGPEGIPLINDTPGGADGPVSGGTLPSVPVTIDTQGITQPISQVPVILGRVGQRVGQRVGEATSATSQAAAAVGAVTMSGASTAGADGVAATSAAGAAAASTVTAAGGRVTGALNTPAGN